MAKTINGIGYHDDSFELTVDAVRTVNPYAANYGRDSLLGNMRHTAERLAAEGGLGYSSTLGYVVSLFADKNQPSGVGAVASVSAYSVLQHLNGRKVA